MAFWWVFQGDSYKRAKEGRYLWAPQQDRKGHRLFHWTNMTRVQIAGLRMKAILLMNATFASGQAAVGGLT